MVTFSHAWALLNLLYIRIKIYVAKQISSVLFYYFWNCLLDFLTHIIFSTNIFFFLFMFVAWPVSQLLHAACFSDFIDILDWLTTDADPVK